MYGKVQEIDAEQFEAAVLKSTTPVVLDFYSTECPPCEALAPKFEALSEIYGDDVRFIKIFRQENRELADTLGVKSSPTLLYFAGGKEAADRQSGGIKRAAIEEALQSLLPPPRVEQLRERIRPTRTECDVLIVGGGPAGLTAGIYTAQAKLDTIVVDRNLAGGNLTITHQISNFPGFPKPQPGYMLAHHMIEHAKAAGAKLREAVDITSTNLARSEVVIDGTETIHAKRILVATGSSPRVIGVKGELENRGKGISYCATCDAKYYEDKHVVVIGGGNSAIEEALFIAKFASKITIVHQFDQLQANKSAQEAAFANPKIGFLFSHEPREFVREGAGIGSVLVEDLKTKTLKTIDCDGVFIFAGMVPNLELFDETFELDEWGYIRADADMRTNIAHVFAGGDVISKRYRQMTTAVNDGTIAAMAMARELEAESAAAAARIEPVAVPA